MTMKYDSRSCTITTNWEWVITSGSGATKTVTVSGIGVATTQEWAWDGTDWAQVGSPHLSSSYNTYNYSDSDGYTNPSLPLLSWSAGTISPPSFSGTTIDQRTTTSGDGTASYSGTVTQTSSVGWGAVSTTNSASSSISYDDGTYAGTLSLDSVSGSPSPPSYSGSYIGDTATTNSSGTAYYSGDVPLKDTGGGRPSNWTWATLVSSSPVYELGSVLKADVVSYSEWNSFCNRINQFRQYKNLANYGFTTVTSKSNFTHSIYEEARIAISSMTSAPSSVSTGDTGVNAKVNALSNALNTIV